jgi:putative phosphonate transport system ATP-binding protein
MRETGDPPLLVVRDLTKRFGARIACDALSFSLWPGEVLGIVGESGSGKTTLLRCIAGHLAPEAGSIVLHRVGGSAVELTGLDDVGRRRRIGSAIGFVHQNPRDGLRLALSAGANIAEKLLQDGQRHYGTIRDIAEAWMSRVELDAARIDEAPRAFSGGMQQRLQIARTLVANPPLVLMDEPTGGLDVSVQARLLDLIRRLGAELGLAVILVTHDLGVVRLLAERLMVMQDGRVVEQGLTDQVLDDPRQPYTQLLVSSVLHA